MTPGKRKNKRKSKLAQMHKTQYDAVQNELLTQQQGTMPRATESVLSRRRIVQARRPPPPVASVQEGFPAAPRVLLANVAHESASNKVNLSSSTSPTASVNPQSTPQSKNKKKTAVSHVSHSDLRKLVRSRCEHCRLFKQDLLCCGRCLAFYYCCKECQVADWPAHGEICKFIKPKAASNKKTKKKTA